MPRRPRNKPLLDAFGRHAKQARITAELSQQELADRMGVRPEAVSLIESGDLSPTLTTLVELARGLGVAPSALLDFEKPVVADPRGSEEASLLGEFRTLGIKERAIVLSVVRGLKKD